ncbi:MAG: DUF3243 domain-containing protein [Candidatus Pristimantibacillus lignocellulolyticus]|uniref:DUF3243 domain-containing protein n=1 Tax=Candidatus Pristimantibacillus lignocellulolyticus TaxID=2994561 RepID=A0A9J6ZBJ4_9BACL|nr:MAG: DUF3243 domain-containing protein [Candidatus Pristimantibacillus lignocellulolyticus]
MSSVLDQFESWKDFLKDRVAQGKTLGLSEETIANLAYEIGSFLDERVDPKNNEQAVLKQLWDVGDDSDRHAIAKLMVKLAEKS